MHYTLESSDGVSLPRVLVVDDQPATLLAIEAELQLLGAQVTRAESGEAALVALQTAQFALILLDVNLPHMSVQVTANLLNNAARYTPPGGQLRVTCHRVDEHVDLLVQDNGIGIANDALFDLFEPFTQEGRLESSGLGLGLAIVRRLVLLHGGSVEARSEGPGLGSEFAVRLPLTSVNDRAIDAEFGGTSP